MTVPSDILERVRTLNCEFRLSDLPSREELFSEDELYMDAIAEDVLRNAAREVNRLAVERFYDINLS